MPKLRDPLEGYPGAKPQFENSAGRRLARVIFMDGLVSVTPGEARLTERQKRTLVRVALGQPNIIIADRLTKAGLFTTPSDVKKELAVVSEVLGIKERQQVFPAAVSQGDLSIVKKADPIHFPARLPELEVVRWSMQGKHAREIGPLLDPPIQEGGVETRIAYLRNRVCFSSTELYATCAAWVGYIDATTFVIDHALVEAQAAAFNS